MFAYAPCLTAGTFGICTCAARISIPALRRQLDAAGTLPASSGCGSCGIAAGRSAEIKDGRQLCARARAREPPALREIRSR